MVAAHRDHKDALPVLRNIGVVGGVENLGVYVGKPITRALNFRLDTLKRSAPVVEPEVLDVLEQQHPGLCPSELADDAYDLQEKQTALILKSQFVAGNGKWLAWKSCRQNIDRHQGIAMNAQALNVFVNASDFGKIQFESVGSVFILLIRPDHASASFVKGAAKPAYCGKKTADFIL